MRVPNWGTRVAESNIYQWVLFISMSTEILIGLSTFEMTQVEH